MKVIRVLLFALLIDPLWHSSAYAQLPFEEQTAHRQRFEGEYEAWKRDCDRVAFSSDTNSRLQSEHFKRIVAMGPAVLPYIVEKSVEDPNFAWIVWAWLYVARVNPDPMINPWAKEPMADWWSGGKKQARVRFETLYGQWKYSREQGDTGQVRERQRTMQALGISVLPYLIEKLDAAAVQLLEVIEQLTGTAADTSGLSPEQRIGTCRTWWAQNKEKWLVPFPNKQPVAKVGPDRLVAIGDTVQLDGSSSSDPDDDELRYVWTQVSGPTVELLNAQTAGPTFVAPRVEKPTAIVFRLQVDDGSPRTSVHTACESGMSKPIEVTITVEPGG
ncbi:MAG TPA: PKD domain-containing protein [Sedimentisphaerales bacterium]|nr:PKD domain-containing protein [Sedimentisphaerales bacterium]HRS11530.1 PKD domain-containing protein [Sedimentisphaerales bacterium]HRV48218.1 PKD domain-containing protein [Sedimentisphaerales bacterium]